VTVHTEIEGDVLVVTIDRPQVRNAVDRETAAALFDAFTAFDTDDSLGAAVLTGAEGTFCAGADLKMVAGGAPGRQLTLRPNEAPMGPTYLLLSKPVIAAVEGHAVAGGLELAIWCDLRVAATDAVFGVYCRRWGVPLMDGGTIRLTRLLGHSHALDLILSGRGVSGDEARMMGLANRLVEPGAARAEAVALAQQITGFPPICMRSDRMSSYEQWSMPLSDALAHERERGYDVLRSGETSAGAARFVAGKGRHGSFSDLAD
jgi:enoyl-CoA hydratase